MGEWKYLSNVELCARSTPRNLSTKCSLTPGRDWLFNLADDPCVLLLLAFDRYSIVGRYSRRGATWLFNLADDPDGRRATACSRLTVTRSLREGEVREMDLVRRRRGARVAVRLVPPF